MDCKIIQKQIRPKKGIPLPRKYKDKYRNTVFHESPIRTDEDYGKAHRQKTNQRLLEGFVPLDLEDEADSNVEIWDKIVLPSSPSTSPRGASRAKPYIKILKGKEIHIIKWPSKYLKNFDMFQGLSKNEIACIKIDEAAREFAEWWTDLGINSTEEEKDLNTETIKKMFAVEFDEHVSRSLAVITKEMMCVPKQITEATCQLQASVSAILKRQTACDAIAESRELNTKGFNTSLPKELKFFPPNNHTQEGWIDIQEVPKDLDIMETVWEGITDLKSTKEFYNWLQDHPNKKMPPYLESVYETNLIESPKCATEDLMKDQKISQTLMPVLRRQNSGDIDEIRKKALEDL